MPQFNVGDRVRLIDNFRMKATTGAEGEVTKAPADYGPDYVDVAWDRDDERNNGQASGTFRMTRFEIVRAA